MFVLYIVESGSIGFKAKYQNQANHSLRQILNIIHIYGFFFFYPAKPTFQFYFSRTTKTYCTVQTYLFAYLLSKQSSEHKDAPLNQKSGQLVFIEEKFQKSTKEINDMDIVHMDLRDPVLTKKRTLFCKSFEQLHFWKRDLLSIRQRKRTKNSDNILSIMNIHI